MRINKIYIYMYIYYIYNIMKIFYDGINIQKFSTVDFIEGFTTNPSIIKNINTQNYKDFALEMLKFTNNKCVSFEVFADDHELMIKEAEEISLWDKSIYVKIPIINTRGEYSIPVIQYLQNKKIKLNITAVFTKEQIDNIINIINPEIPVIISIFAGRIADTGVDPTILIKYTVEYFKNYQNVEILWASIREPYNITEARNSGCHIITVPDAILNKYIECNGKDLTEFSIETVKMFYNDGLKSGIKIFY